MEWLLARAGDWVQGLPARVEHGARSDYELLEALRKRTVVAPRHVVGAFDKPTAFPTAHPDAVAGAESRLGFRTDDGAIVTVAGERDFTNTGHTLRSWLGPWLDGVDLWKAMFEAGPTRIGINPYTKQPIELEGQGKPRGTPWP